MASALSVMAMLYASPRGTMVLMHKDMAAPAGVVDHRARAFEKRPWCIFESGVARFVAASIQALTNRSDGLTGLHEFSQAEQPRPKVVDISRGVTVARRFDIAQPREELKFARAQLEMQATDMASGERDKRLLLRLLGRYASKLEPGRNLLQQVGAALAASVNPLLHRARSTKLSLAYRELCRKQVEKLEAEARFELIFEEEEASERKKNARRLDHPSPEDIFDEAVKELEATSVIEAQNASIKGAIEASGYGEVSNTSFGQSGGDGVNSGGANGGGGGGGDDRRLGAERSVMDVMRAAIAAARKPGVSSIDVHRIAAWAYVRAVGSLRLASERHQDELTARVHHDIGQLFKHGKVSDKVPSTAAERVIREDELRLEITDVDLRHNVHNLLTQYFLLWLESDTGKGVHDEGQEMPSAAAASTPSWQAGSTASSHPGLNWMEVYIKPPGTEWTPLQGRPVTRSPMRRSSRHPVPSEAVQPTEAEKLVQRLENGEREFNVHELRGIEGLRWDSYIRSAGRRNVFYRPVPAAVVAMTQKFEEETFLDESKVQSLTMQERKERERVRQKQRQLAAETFFEGATKGWDTARELDGP